MTKLAQRLQQAVDMHNAGQFGQAEAIYRDELAREPMHPDLLHWLGVLLHQTGRTNEAIETLHDAIARRDDADGHLHLADVLAESNRPREAEAHYRQAIARQPDAPAPYLNLGSLLQQSGRPEDAEQVYRSAIKRGVFNARIFSNLGAILQLREAFDAAAACYRRAIEADPNLPQAHANLACALRALDQPDEAERHFRRAIELAPNRLMAHHNLGELLDSQERYDEAESCYAEALKIDPLRYESLVNLGRLYHDQARYEDALAQVILAIQSAPNRPEAYNNLGKTYHSLGRLEEAVAQFDASLAIDPTDADVRMNRALANLQNRNFHDGWLDHEWRFQVKSLPKRPRVFSIPRWDGEPLRNRHLLIHGEQGIGDEIFFATAWADIVDEPAHCTVTCDPRLAPLFARSFPTAKILGVERGQENWDQITAQGPDVHVPAGSVPRYTRKSLADFPARAAILTADSTQRARWRDRLGQIPGAFNVGISWRAGKHTREAKLRTTNLREWRPLLDVPGARFINLQYGTTADEIRQIKDDCGGRIAHDLDLDPLHDIDGFAALLAELDLVISVGNATVHLGGALGVPTWCLLPKFWGWRWPLNSDTSIWYPSVRLLRQQNLGDWHTLMADCADRLTVHMRTKRT